jgi:hypothetical protein
VQFINDVKEKAADLVAENASTLLTAGGVVGTVTTAAPRSSPDELPSRPPTASSSRR